MAWQSNDSSSSSSHVYSPTGFDATTLFLADSISTYSSPPTTPISTAFPTASDAADVNHFPTAANANADVHTVLSQPTASYATMLWEGEDDASDDTDQHTAFQAAMAW